MKEYTAKWLKGIRNGAKNENKSVDKWIKDGHCIGKTSDFLENWLDKEVEQERKGRTDEKMASDLVQELLEMKKRNEVKIRLARHFLETRKAPICLDMMKDPIIWKLHFEDFVDAVMACAQ